METAQDPSATTPDPAQEAKSLYASWTKELSAARKREKDFRAYGKRIIELYEAEKKEEHQFNILFSNTETLAPALYNSTPRPVVQRRFKDEDPTGLAAANLTQRALEFLVDNETAVSAAFDELMQNAVLQALLPGRGILRFKYDAVFAPMSPAAEAAEPAQGPSADDTPQHEQAEGEVVQSEYVCGEVVPWSNFLHGYAVAWKDVPWVAFEHTMTAEELRDTFGSEIAAAVNLTDAGETDEDDHEKVSHETSTAKVAQVYEIWDKVHRKVLFISSGYPDGVLKSVEDPLKLQGFYPCPRPLSFIRRVNSLTPVALYAFYEEQAKELNRVTVRINKLIAALKVRGFYDATVEGLDKVLAADDNTLIPAENVAALQQGQTLDKAIFLMPIEKLIAVLQQLYGQRQQVKQVIYEITGIADIMRGSSAASETLGAQQIKNQWGTMRLKRSQKEVMRFVRESLRIMAEIAVSNLSPQTLKSMTGVPYPLQQQKIQAQTEAELAEAHAVTSGQPPQIPPRLQQLITMPSMEELLQLLQDDIQRSYRIDIETDSTIAEETAENRKDAGETMNAIAQFLNGMGPAMQQGLLPFDAAKGMLLGIVRNFKFGNDVEDLIKQMKQPPPPPPAPAKPQPAAESPQVIQAQAQAAVAEAQSKEQLLRLEMEFKTQEHQFKVQELSLKGQLALAQTQAKLQAFAAKTAPITGQ